MKKIILTGSLILTGVTGFNLYNSGTMKVSATNIEKHQENISQKDIQLTGYVVGVYNKLVEVADIKNREDALNFKNHNRTQLINENKLISFKSSKQQKFEVGEKVTITAKQTINSWPTELINPIVNKHEFIGKTFTITYDENDIFKVKYVDDKTIEWEGIEGVAKGASGKENITYRQLSPGIFFINWLEKEGFSVSQTLDLNKMTVYAYNTYDEDGKRKELFRTGKLVLQNK
ncbi:MoaF N-terminal domain-containing protein [Bacillus cereus]|nr:MoaF N-terminal domain-containing protein [Bacillus cereus]